MPAQTSRPTIWHTPDDLWSRIAPLFGPDEPPGTVGRPAVPASRTFDAIIYLPRTVCQWRAIPREAYAPGPTVHTRFRRWVASGVFARAWRLLLEH